MRALQSCPGGRPYREKYWLSRSSSGFTLIELLVVIAIIAILASMLLPALGKARATARAAECMSRQKQLVLLMHIYMEDFEGWFPRSERNGQGAWTWYLYTPEYAVSPVSVPGQNRGNDVSMYYCPSWMNGEQLTSLWWETRQSGYIFQTYGYRWTPAPSGYPGNYSFVDSRSIQNPSSYHLIGDSIWTSTDWGWLNQFEQASMAFGNGNGWSRFNKAHCRHNNKANIGLSDGSARGLGRNDLASELGIPTTHSTTYP